MEEVDVGNIDGEIRARRRRGLQGSSILDSEAGLVCSTIVPFHQELFSLQGFAGRGRGAPPTT